MGTLLGKQSTEPWRDFDQSKVYTADLESALHYLLRVELATHNTLEGEELKIFKDFVTLVAKVTTDWQGVHCDANVANVANMANVAHIFRFRFLYLSFLCWSIKMK